MSRKTKLAVVIGLLVTSLSGCTTEQLENAVLGRAKNWCRQQTTGCHVSK